MGYVEMMKNHNGNDETMQRYVLATENTAQRLKQLSDDMFRYSLAFGDTKKGVVLEEYDAPTLFDQMLAEHILLLREKGIELVIEKYGDDIKPGSTVCTDAQNLMRIVDNVFSNLQKYADRSEPVIIRTRIENSIVTIECVNRIRTDTEEAESNGIGLKTCVRLGSLVAKKFEYFTDGDFFTCRLVLDIKPPSESAE
jgi:signal transduction histidine kinase